MLADVGEHVGDLVVRKFLDGESVGRERGAGCFLEDLHRFHAGRVVAECIADAVAEVSAPTEEPRNSWVIS
jgi:hypothetical protein